MIPGAQERSEIGLRSVSLITTPRRPALTRPGSLAGELLLAGLGPALPWGLPGLPPRVAHRRCFAVTGRARGISQRNGRQTVARGWCWG